MSVAVPDILGLSIKTPVIYAADGSLLGLNFARQYPRFASARIYSESGFAAARILRSITVMRWDKSWCIQNRRCYFLSIRCPIKLLLRFEEGTKLNIYQQGVLHLILGLSGLLRVFRQSRCRENRKPSKGNLISERFFVKKLPLSDVLKTHFLSPYEHFKTLLVGCIALFRIC